MNVGCGKFKGQRMTKLSPNEEYLRVNLTWQSFDRAQYVAVWGNDDELTEVVCDPESWRQNLRSTVWVFWGHSAAWLKSGVDMKVILSEAERRSKVDRKRSSR